MRLTALALLPALGVMAQSPGPADKAVAGFNKVIEHTEESHNVAKGINPLRVFTEGPRLIGSFRPMINEARSLENEIRGSSTSSGNEKRDELVPSAKFARGTVTKRQGSSYDEAGQRSICKAFGNLVTTQQQFLSTLVEKHDVLSNTPFRSPLAAVLRVLEGALDNLSSTTVGAVPVCADGAKDQQKTLDEALVNAINTYQNDFLPPKTPDGGGDGDDGDDDDE